MQGTFFCLNDQSVYQVPKSARQSRQDVGTQALRRNFVELYQLLEEGILESSEPVSGDDVGLAESFNLIQLLDE